MSLHSLCLLMCYPYIPASLKTPYDLNNQYISWQKWRRKGKGLKFKWWISGRGAYAYLTLPKWYYNEKYKKDFGSVQFSRSVMSNSLRPRELQHARPPCPSPTPRVHSNSCPLSWWCHPAISSSVIPFSSCPQSLPASESFPMSQLFAWGGQSIGVSASASVLPTTTRTDLL